MEQSPAHFACPPPTTCHIADDAPDEQATDDDEYQRLVLGEEPEVDRHVLGVLNDERRDNPGEGDQPAEAGDVTAGPATGFLLW